MKNTPFARTFATGAERLRSFDCSASCFFTSSISWAESVTRR
jgi:hypothetical protein